MWTVSEAKTGFKIAEGKSGKEAMDNAKAILADIKAKKSSTVGTSQVKEVSPIKTTPLSGDTLPTTPKTETVEQAISRKVRQESFAKAGGDNSLPSIVEKTATNFKQMPEKKAKVYFASKKYDKLDDFINS